MNGTCSLCGVLGHVVKHHICYVPIEKTTVVCDSCHKKEHVKNPLLKPPRGLYPHLLSFAISESQHERKKNLPREFNLSKPLQEELERILLAAGL